MYFPDGVSMPLMRLVWLCHCSIHHTTNCKLLHAVYYILQKKHVIIIIVDSGCSQHVWARNIHTV